MINTRRRQPSPCTQIKTVLLEEMQVQTSPGMASSYCKLPSIIPIFVFFLLANVSLHVRASAANITLQPEMLKFRRIRAHLRKLNKPSLKTIKRKLGKKNYDIGLINCSCLSQSPDGDLIDCVLSHLQPAFDHPRLKGQRPLLDLPALPKGYNLSSAVDENFQAWTISGECPEGTIPIRRTREEDILRASSIARFAKKLNGRVRRDSTSSGHEHAIGYVIGDQYYGAKASLSVWSPRIATSSEFSLSQMWVISGSFGNDLNTIEAGWQVSPQLYGDDRPRFFTYWTSDAYQETGCYNLWCSGFVQTNNRIAIGAAISPMSIYSGAQYDMSLLIWKDPNHGHWWLQYGSGALVGYWPSLLFSHLAGHADMVQFGGEIVNSGPSGFHTMTQMGSGHFASEDFRRAAYFRNLQVVDWDNSLLPLPDLRLLADHPNCYSIKGGTSKVWGNFFYYGGPGRNANCP